MRITSDTQFQQTMRNLQNNFARMTKLQDQIGSGKKLNRPSDGPVEMAQVLRNKRETARLDTHSATIRDASTTLQSSVDVLTETREVLTRAKEIAIEAGSGASEPTASETLAKVVDAAISQLLGAANRRLPDGRYLFAGTASNTQPFTILATDNAGRPTSIAYRGTEESSEVVVGPNQTVAALIPGRAFQSQNGSLDAFQTLITLRDTIRNTNGLSSGDRSAAITRTIGELDNISVAVVDTLGAQAVQAEQLNQLAERSADMELNLKAATNELESTDFATAIAELQQQQNLYEASLALAARLSSLDLSQFLK